MRPARDAALPVTIVGGYLGAGKTTLINHLLRQAAGLRLAVLVNDFGELPIDADLIEADDGELLSLAGGCICCSYGSDLMGALMNLPRRAPPPDHVLVEASGVALPGAVAAAISLLAGVALDAVVVLADAETVRARAADPYLADTIERQLRAADLVVVNKRDLVAPHALASLHAWLATQAPGARLLDAVRGRLPLEALLGVDRGSPRSAKADRLLSGALQPHPAAAAEALFERSETQVAQRVDSRGLAAALADPALGVIRAKGVLVDRDGNAVVLQVVGARAELSPLAAGRAPVGRLVCIGLKGRLDHASIRAALDDATGHDAGVKKR